jgi:glycosyltransferase involved in cell wall biosynthesis
VHITTIAGITPISADRDSRACRIAASCARLGYRSVLLEGFPSENFSLEGVEIVPLRQREPGRGLGPLRAPARLFGDFLARPALRMPRADLVCLHAFYQYPGVRLRIGRRRVPLIYDAHDFYTSLRSHRDQSWLQRKVEVSTERALVRRATSVVTVSEGVSRLLEDRFGVRSEVLMNSHDSRLDEPVAQTVRQRIGAAASDLVVVMVGHCKPEQPVRPILEALSASDPRVRIAFIGNGYVGACEEDARELGVGDRASFLPAQPPTQVVPFIADADAAGVLYRPTVTGIEQCLPNRLFQGLAASLPIVFAGDLPLVAPLVADAGLPVTADDPSSIADAFNRLAKDDALRARLAAAAAVRAGEVAWEKEEQRLGAIIRRALGRDDQRVSVKDDNRAA